MSDSQEVTRRRLIAAAAGVGLAVLAPETSAADPAAQPKGTAAKVDELRKERIAILRGVADGSLRLAQSARCEVREALEDQIALHAAELDAAEKESERGALRKQVLDSLTTLEELAQARFAAARGTKLDVLRVRARRLEIELQSEQAKETAAK